MSTKESTEALLATIRKDGTITSFSYYASFILGYSSDETMGKNFCLLFAHSSLKDHEKKLNAFINSTASRSTVSLSARSGHLHSCTAFIEPHESNSSLLNIFIIDEANQRGRERTRSMLVSELLRRSHYAETTEELIRGTSTLLKEYSGASAVAIRLNLENTYPYFEVSGFSNEFSAAENYICSQEELGKANPRHQCLCGAVLEERQFDSPYFNEYGTFYTGNTLDILKNKGQFPEDYALRGKCAFDGYLSVALIPFRLRGKIFGLLQLNSLEENAFPRQLIRSIEEISEELVVIIDGFRQRQLLQKANRKLEEQKNHLESINQELKLFSAEMTHDLRSPLNQIKQYALLLEQDLMKSAPESTLEFVKRIKGLVPQMQELITNVIALTRIDNAAIDSLKFNLSQLTDTVIRDAMIEFSEQEVESSIEEDIYVTSDPSLLRVVMANLVNNAIKYSSSKEKASLTFGRTERNGKTEYYLRDNGIGIKEDELKELFTPFKRLSNSKGFAGTGIGLASVKRSITRLGGTIRCESEPGKGTAFFFTLGDLS